jgi:thiol:disulfide interchange protein DsbD
MTTRFNLWAPGLVLCAALAANAAGAETASAPVVTPHVRAQLVALDRVDGGRVSLGLRMMVKPGWHTYWRNPGDSGEPPTLRLSTPDGASASIVGWPAPERVDIGGIVSYGHHGEMLFVAQATVPNGASRIEAEATWLVCEKVCVPEAGKFALELAAIDPPDAATVALKPVLPPSVEATLARAGDKLRLNIEVAKLGGTPVAAYFFPYQIDVVDHSAKQSFRVGEGSLALDLTPFDARRRTPLELSGVLEIEILADGGRKTRRFEVLARFAG